MDFCALYIPVHHTVCNLSFFGNETGVENTIFDSGHRKKKKLFHSLPTPEFPEA